MHLFKFSQNISDKNLRNHKLKHLNAPWTQAVCKHLFERGMCACVLVCTCVRMWASIHVCVCVCARVHARARTHTGTLRQHWDGKLSFVPSPPDTPSEHAQPCKAPF